MPTLPGYVKQRTANLGTGARTNVSPAITPVAGETLVVFAGSQSPNVILGAITDSSGELTWTQQAANAAASSCPAKLWTAVVPANYSGAALTVTLAFTNNVASQGGHTDLVVSRWGDVSLPATPNTRVVGGSTTQTSTLTGVLPGSAVAFFVADFNGVQGTATLTPTASTVLESYQFTTAGILSAYSGGYIATAGGTTTFGMAAPTGQKVTLLAIELPATTVATYQASDGIVSGSAVGSGGTVTSPLSGLRDDFSAASTEWTDSGAATVSGGAHVNVWQNAGAAVYSSRRSRAAYQWPGSAIVVGDVVMPGQAGDAANAQLWVRDPNPAATVDRLGWEFKAATNTLDLLGQTGAGYSFIGGTKTSLPYDPVAHRWLKLEHTGTAVIWSTSPDGLTWTAQRTLNAPPAWTNKLGLQTRWYGCRTSGTTAVLRFASVNVAQAVLPTAPPVGSDALQRRTLGELRAWKQWLDANGARGYVGEFGWVTLRTKYGDPAQGALWSGLGDAYLTDLDVLGLMGTVWAAGREWGGGYPLGTHVGTAVGDPLTIANADSAPVIAAHPTRGTGSATRWRGVSIAGHERGLTITGGGTIRTDPPHLHTAADFLFLASTGVDTVRLALAWERLQPTLGGALDTAALAAVDAMLTGARQAGLRTIIDLHNYGRYTAADGSVQVLGAGLTSAQLSDFWVKLSAWVTANATRSASVIGYGLQNEPHALPGGVDTWHNASQAALTALRNAGDNRLILVAGYQFSSLTSWAANHPVGWITDPAGAFAYEAHHYWDTASIQGSRSGTYQQDNGAGGMQIETYATELAAAEAGLQASDGIVSGTRVTAAASYLPVVASTIVSGSRVTSSGASVGTSGADAVVSGSQVAASPFGEYDGGAVPMRSGSRVTAAASRTTSGAAAVVSGTRVGIAPSTPAAAAVVSGSAVTPDPFKTTEVGASIVSGSITLAPDVYTSPAVAVLSRSGSRVTAAPILDAQTAATVASGTRVDTAGTRSTTAAVGIVSGTQVGAGVIGAGEAAATVCSGTTVTAAPQQTSTIAAAIVSGVVTTATPLGVTALVSGSTVTAAPRQTEVASATVLSGSTVTSAAPRGTMFVSDAIVSGSRITATAVTIRDTGVRPIVSSSRVDLGGVGTVKLGAVTAVSGSQVAAKLDRGQTVAASVVSGSVVRVDAAAAYTPVFAIPTGTVKPQVPVPTTRLLVAETITGRVVAELAYQDLAWTSPLNKIGTSSATLPVTDALDLLSDGGSFAERNTRPRNALRAILLGPYRFSLVPCFGTQALMGGPLLPTDDLDDTNVKIAGAGMERMLEKRVLNNLGVTGLLADEVRDIVAKNTNPAGAILKVVSEAMATYNGVARSLPITCMQPPNTSGDENFVWKSYDAVKAWKAIGDLVARPDGPDVRLEPMLRETSAGFYVTWDLQFGDPTFGVAPGNIGPDGPMPWTWDDTTAKITRTIDAVGLASTYFSLGGGQDRAKEIGLSLSDRLLRLGFPPLEEVDSGASSEANPDNVQRRAVALQRANAQPTDTWKVDARTDGRPPLGAFRRGDIAQLDVRRKLLIEPGTYLRRITSISGSGSRRMSIDCDYEDELSGVG